MFGIKSVKEEKVKSGELAEEIKKISEEEAKKLAIKEFEALRSICLDCKHAFVEKFLENPEEPDPMNLICRRKIEVLGALVSQANHHAFYMCEGNVWHKKHLSCSDFEKRTLTTP